MANAKPPAPSRQFTESTGRLIVKYQHAQKKIPPVAINARRTKRLQLRDQADTELVKALSHDRELIAPQGPLSDTGMQQLAKTLGQMAAISWASVEYRRFAQIIPNDPLYQSATGNTDQRYLYDGQYSLQTPQSWDISTGATSTIIAVVDTGILPEHPDLRDKSVATLGYDFVTADSAGIYTTANDGDGRDSDPTDPGDSVGRNSSSWHGTGVASVIAANSNDGIGMTGVDWHASLLHARALGTGGGTDADIIDAVRWSAGLDVAGVPTNPNPAQIINLSFGGNTPCTQAWQEALDEVTALGVVFVMAAGNESNNALRSSPGNCANVITVGASTLDGHGESNYSNYGLKVTTSAPGSNILLATNQGTDAALSNGYNHHNETGTSFSVALVAGSIGLIKSLNTDLSPQQVRQILLQSATPFVTPGTCDHFYCGAGILNLPAALQMASASSFDSNSPNPEINRLESNASPLTLDVDSRSTLGSYRDIRYFTIDIDASGVLSLETQASEKLFTYLLNSRASVIAQQGAVSPAKFRVAAAVTPGRYYIAVERSFHQNSDSTITFSLQPTLATWTPQTFTFANVKNVAANATIQSETVTLAGLPGPAPIVISNGSYSLNGAEHTFDSGMVDNGDVVAIAVRTSPAPDSTTAATVQVGSYSTQFSATTRANLARQSGCTSLGNSGKPNYLLVVLLAFSLLRVIRVSQRKRY